MNHEVALSRRHGEHIPGGDGAARPTSRRRPRCPIVVIGFLMVAAANVRADPNERTHAESTQPPRNAGESTVANPDDSKSKGGPRPKHDRRTSSGNGGSSSDIAAVAGCAVAALAGAAGIFFAVAEVYLDARREALDKRTPTDAWRETDGTGQSHWRLPLVPPPYDRYFQSDR